MVRDGDQMLATRDAERHRPRPLERIPAVGDKAPSCTRRPSTTSATSPRSTPATPTTRCTTSTSPTCIGKEPVVLLFATPALCQSRVCGPVVDVAEQVKSERRRRRRLHPHGGLQDNDPNKPDRPQLAAYGLQTEPWLFVIDSDGRVSTRIEGAFSADELTNALAKAGV